MPYITRDPEGKILRVSVTTLIGGEMLPHGHAEIVEFLQSRNSDPKEIEASLKQLRDTDNEMARATEDLIMVLLKKNIIKMSEMPRPVQERIELRVKLRARVKDAYEKASRV